MRGRDQAPGAVRNEQNWIGTAGGTINQASFIPIPQEHLAAGLERWATFIADGNQPDALVQLALAHLEFEAVRPAAHHRRGTVSSRLSRVYTPGRRFRLEAQRVSRLSARATRISSSQGAPRLSWVGTTSSSAATAGDVLGRWRSLVGWAGMATVVEVSPSSETTTSMLACAAAMAGVLAVLGFVTAGVGIVAFLWFETTVNPHHPERSSTLVTSGVFALTRNPMYLGLALLLAAWAFRLGSLPSLIFVSVFMAYLQRFQIEPEERQMQASFGEEFEGYARRVRRWL